MVEEIIPKNNLKNFKNYIRLISILTVLMAVIFIEGINGEMVWQKELVESR